jgi:hypothetical protein
VNSDFLNHQWNPNITNCLPEVSTSKDTIHIQSFAGNVIQLGGRGLLEDEFSEHLTRFNFNIILKDNELEFIVDKIEYRGMTRWITLDPIGEFQEIPYSENGIVNPRFQRIQRIPDYLNILTSSLNNYLKDNLKKSPPVQINELNTQLHILKSEINQVNLQLDKVFLFGKQHRLGNHLLIGGLIGTGIGSIIMLRDKPGNSIDELKLGRNITIAGSLASSVGWVITLNSFKHFK